MKHNVKKFLSLLLAFSMVLSLMSVSVFANGETTEPAASTQLTEIARGEKTYLVSQVMANSLKDQPTNGDSLWTVCVSVPEDFVAINQMFADGLMSYNNGTECQRTIKVANDIDFTGKSFTSLQGMRILLDGQKHTISNLTITGDSTTNRAGLLSYGGSSEIKDLTLNNVTATGTQVGAFIGNAEGGKLTRVTLSGKVALTYASGDERWNAIGAFVGWSSGTTLTNVAIADNTSITIDATGMSEGSDPDAIPHWSSHPRYIGSNAKTSVTGIVSVGQNVSYSYKPSPVAKRGDNEYISLEDAFAAANDGDTITLLADCAGNGIKAPQGKFSDKGLTVDFGGYTYTMDGTMVGSTGTETQAFQLLKDNKITFKNGAITTAKAKMLIQNYSDLTLDGMNLSMSNANYARAYTVSNNNGTVTIKDTTISANTAGGFAFDVCRYSSYPSVNVTVTGNSTINGNIEVSASGNDAKDGFSLEIQSGTINGAIVVDSSAETAMTNAPEKATISITGGKFSSDPSEYVPEGVPVVKMNNMYYVGSIQAAVNEAPNDGTQTTIEILRDATDGGVGLFRTAKTGFTQATNKNLIFDFNEHTLTIGTPLVGSTGTESQSFHLEKGNTVTLKDGKLYSDEAAMLIQNYCDLTLDNMEVGRATDHYSYALSNNNGDITIKDTTITASSGKVAFDVCVTNYYPDGARVTVKGNSVINGTIEYDVWGTQPAVNKTGLNIKGGTFNGSFTVEEDLEAAALEKFSITGGTFSTKPNAGYVATGYKAYANDTEPETYTVKKVEVSVPTTAPTKTEETVMSSTNEEVAKTVTYQVSDHNTAGAPAQEITVTSSKQVTVNDINVTEVLATAVAAVDSSATSVDVALSLVTDDRNVGQTTAVDEDEVFEIHPLATITTTTTGSEESSMVEEVKLSELAKPINVTLPVESTETYAVVYHYPSNGGAREKIGTFPIIAGEGSSKTVTFPAQNFSVYALDYTSNANAFNGVLSYVFEATGEKSENNASIVDVELGGTVSVDVYLKNAQASATENTNTVYVSAGTFTLALPSGLKYGGFVTEVGLTANLDKVANGIKFYCTQEDAIKIAAGARTKIGTLTLNVDTIENEDLFYGKALTISANEGGVAISNAVEDAEVAAATPTQVEIVTKYPIHWAGQFTDWTMDSVLMGDDVETTYVGARILPTHVNPTRTGYTFAGWDTTIVKAVAEATYTAQWTANEQAISIEQKGDFNGIVSAAVGETEGTKAKTNETVTLNVEPPTGYHVSSVVVSYTDKNGEDQLAAVTTETENSEYSFTMPGYAVTVTVTYAINAKVAFADYKYGNAKTEAPTKLVLVGVDNELLTANKVLKLGITADAEAEPTFVPMFKTTDENYLSILNSNGNDAADTYGTAYVYIVAGGTEKSNILGALKVVTDTASANKEIARNGDVNGNNQINITDVGIVDDLLYQRTSAATVQMRLEADMDTSDGETTTMDAGSDMFGSLNDIVEIIKVINNLTANTNSDN